MAQTKAQLVDISTTGISAGSASTPGITFTGDLNTGIYSPGADQVAISTNGTQRVTVNSSGGVAIGSLSTPGSCTVVGPFTVSNSSDAASIFYGSSGELRVGSTAAQPLIFRINSSEVARFDSSGRLGIGTTNPVFPLHVETTGQVALRLRTTSSNTSNPSIQIVDPTSAKDGLFTYTSDGIAIGSYSAHPLSFIVQNSERARIDTSGRLLVGTSTARAQQYTTPRFQIEGSGYTQAHAQIWGNSNDQYGGYITLGKSRGSGYQLVSNGDEIGRIDYIGSDGTKEITAADIRCVVDGTPGTNDMPGRLVFSTTADGASSPTERMRIANDGAVFIGKTGYGSGVTGVEIHGGGRVYATSSGAICGLYNRNTNDGDLVLFRQDDATEGSISVSGTTVSYNGAHLSRWSQLPSGAERIEILRGSVLSNIDEMCEWGEEDNEQLNRMKVSDVEGDKNVSGVFQAWDDDDDTYTNDFYCAMTGDFIIRIAAGVTVERGDLLMSAGDGTAKPQDDDIIRSKTIAKVTSTNVSCTYDDGSYCVPCVLMAC